MIIESALCPTGILPPNRGVKIRLRKGGGGTGIEPLDIMVGKFSFQIEATKKPLEFQGLSLWVASGI
jgi:hypothetical protein